MNVFYDHLINIHDLHIELDRYELSTEERNELMKLADSTVHHEVFDLIMIELPEEHKVVFLERFATDPSDPELLEFVKIHVPQAEEKIRARSEKVKQDLTEKMRRIR